MVFKIQMFARQLTFREAYFSTDQLLRRKPVYRLISKHVDGLHQLLLATPAYSTIHIAVVLEETNNKQSSFQSHIHYFVSSSLHRNALLPSSLHRNALLEHALQIQTG